MFFAINLSWTDTPWILVLFKLNFGKSNYEIVLKLLKSSRENTKKVGNVKDCGQSFKDGKGRGRQVISNVITCLRYTYVFLLILPILKPGPT